MTSQKNNENHKKNSQKLSQNTEKHDAIFGTGLSACLAQKKILYG
jgi:hypothetical protein